MVHRLSLALVAFVLVLAPAVAAQPPAFDSVRIWGEAPHSAFTDLLLHDGVWYCTFREGTGHVPGEDGADGTIRLISSGDGETWESVGLLEYEGVDLRDPKISVTPEGKLMLLMGGSHYDGKILGDRTPMVCFYDPADGSFSDLLLVDMPDPIDTRGEWLWRVTWHDRGVGYGLVYQSGTEPWRLHLVSTSDGVHYGFVKTFDFGGSPNEGTIRFREDGTMVAVVRDGDKSRNERGWLGVSSPPYSDWEWKDIDMRLGGPDFEILEDGTLALGTRDYTGPTRMIVGTLDMDGHFEGVAQLPASGDSSYPGLVVHEGELWVSYYASHEDKTAIYLARLPLSLFE